MATKYDFEGRVAAVTGGAQGIGRAITQRLAEGGAKVVIWDMDDSIGEQAAVEIGGDVSAVTVNVADFDSVIAARDETMSRHGRIDVLVNNAGVAGLNATTWDYPLEEWDRVMQINLSSQFYTCKAVVPEMIAQNYGRIVNIASIAGKEGNPTAVAYSASKAGVISLTKSLGKELANYDISVNAITPAAAKTAIFDQISEEHISYMLSKIPRARFVLVEEVAAMAAFAASEECAFTTGAVFDISGGRATY